MGQKELWRYFVTRQSKTDVTRIERRRRGPGDTGGDRKRKATGDISHFLCDVDLE